MICPLILASAERGGEKHQWVREISIDRLLPTPQLGIEPPTQACALTGSRTYNFVWCWGQRSHQLSPPARAPLEFHGIALKLRIYLEIVNIHNRLFSTNTQHAYYFTVFFKTLL